MEEGEEAGQKGYAELLSGCLLCGLTLDELVYYLQSELQGIMIPCRCIYFSTLYFILLFLAPESAACSSLPTLKEMVLSKVKLTAAFQTHR
jgi:hypothetical protein